MSIVFSSTLSPSDILIIPLKEKPNFKEVLTNIPELKPFLNSKEIKADFKGKEGEMLMFYTPIKNFRRILLVGLGNKNRPKYRQIGGNLRRKIKNIENPQITLFLYKENQQEDLITALLQGFLLAGYKYSLHSKSPEKNIFKKINIFAPNHKLKLRLQELQDLCEAVIFTRDLVNTPANKQRPEDLAQQAKELAKNNRSIKCTILNERKLERLKMGAVLAVGQGSLHPPRLITLEYQSKCKNAPTLAIVGKGITFDTGGINLKRDDWLKNMKLDMAGAATVLGVFKMLSKGYELPVNLIGVIAAAENAISQHATKPGDIITTYIGKTVEITNTDAEGRLILADAVAYAIEKHDLHYLLDFATLTGACLATFGNEITAVVTNNDILLPKIKEASKNTDEKIWQLPLDPDLAKKTKGDISDLKNWSPGVFADTIMGASFIGNFVGETPWYHFDIAGTAWSPKGNSYTQIGGTGANIRLLWDLLNNC